MVHSRPQRDDSPAPGLDASVLPGQRSTDADRESSDGAEDLEVEIQIGRPDSKTCFDNATQQAVNTVRVRVRTSGGFRRADYHGFHHAHEAASSVDHEFAEVLPATGESQVGGKVLGVAPKKAPDPRVTETISAISARVKQFRGRGENWLLWLGSRRTGRLDL